MFNWFPEFNYHYCIVWIEHRDILCVYRFQKSLESWMLISFGMVNGLPCWIHGFSSDHRSLATSKIGLGQYLDGWPLRNTAWCFKNRRRLWGRGRLCIFFYNFTGLVVSAVYQYTVHTRAPHKHALLTSIINPSQLLGFARLERNGLECVSEIAMYASTASKP